MEGVGEVTTHARRSAPPPLPSRPSLLLRDARRGEPQGKAGRWRQAEQGPQGTGHRTGGQGRERVVE